MDDLIADRFMLKVEGGGAARSQWLDLATGRSVRIRILKAGTGTEQLGWSEACACVSRLRHPAFNELIDYGALGPDHLFEAYDASGVDRVGLAIPQRVLAHAKAFLEAQAPGFDRDGRPYLLRRALVHPHRRRKAIGVVVQSRLAFAAIEDALADVAPSGVAAIGIAGPRGSGVKTTTMFAARAARLAGFVPVSSLMLGERPWFGNDLAGRHVCVIARQPDSSLERSRIASLVSRLGAASARRHVMLCVGWTDREAAAAIEVEPMSVDALRQMLFPDPERGPDRRAISAAARACGGWPGVFLDLVGAARFEPHRAQVCLARESSPAYVVLPVVRRRGIGRILLDAPERGSRLARRGRHASAIRLLTRASRVLEVRGERRLAAACAESLGWIERARGRCERAFAAFSRAGDLGGESELGVRGAIGAGVVLTDERRFPEAEAALRSACAAAEVLLDSALANRARRALARCLYWQQRYDEASAALVAVRRDSEGDDGAAESEALRSRIAAAQGDLRLAVISAAKAIQHADATDEDRVIASAAKAMALAQAAVGNGEQVCRWAARGLDRAARAHLPVVLLRLRAIALGAGLRPDRAPSATIKHVRAALRRPGLPVLVRAELESRCEPATPVEEPRGLVAARTLRDLEVFLGVVHAAPDDASGLEALCREVADATRAATVQIVTGSPSPRTLARTGRPWQGELSAVDRVIAGEGCTSPDSLEKSRSAAEAIRFGQETLAVLCCRWTPGTAIDGASALARMKMAALAAASAVRSALDRAHVSIADAAAGELFGSSHAALTLRDAMARAARAPFPVLIEGESGSGKELVARGIHRLGSRRDRRLCAVNCAALADDLLEAELFGHARGAYTGAVGERPGLFEEADGGTLFLDEVGELSARAQAKLLRVLQDGEVRRVGENLARKVDARIIAATNRRLDEEVAANRFRGDLKFRLDVVRLIVPPLRDRASDIPALAALFWNDAASRMGSSATLTSETLAALARYEWPGNVRELQNAIASIAVHAPRRGRVVPSMLPAHIARAARSTATTFEAARADFERRYVRAALAQAAGHRSRAARSLGVSRQGLAKMLRRLGIDGEQ